MAQVLTAIIKTVAPDSEVEVEIEPLQRASGAYASRHFERSVAAQRSSGRAEMTGPPAFDRAKLRGTCSGS